jgi:hypothetical protein
MYKPSHILVEGLNLPKIVIEIILFAISCFIDKGDEILDNINE